MTDTDLHQPGLGPLRVAARGGHYLQRDEPDLVASAICDLMARIREPPASLLAAGRPGPQSW